MHESVSGVVGISLAQVLSDGSDALEMLHRIHYHLVISDLHMQRMDGMTLLGEIRADLALKDLPFIMVTGTNDIERVMEAKRAGVTDYIVKPFTLATLKDKMTSTLGRNRLAKDLRVL